jgi:transcriptional regulator with XRE-family HTH domain
MHQRGGTASLADYPREGWMLRERHMALPSHIHPAQDASRVVYVVAMRHTKGDDFATLVRTGRLASGLSQLALAKAVRVSRETVSRWEFGRQKPENAEVVARVAEALKEDLGRLMRAAGLALDVEGEPKPDPRLRGLDPKDPVVIHILSLDIGEEMRGFMLDRRREIVALRQQQDLAEVEILARRERGAA